MEASTITAGYTGLKFTKELLQTYLAGKVDAESQAKVNSALKSIGEAQDILFELREKMIEVQSENNELRSQLENINEWKEKSEAYSLCKTEGGAVVYKYLSEPEHFACPKCFEEKQIHVLQDRKVASGDFGCPNCKNAFPIEPEAKINPLPINKGF